LDALSNTTKILGNGYNMLYLCILMVVFFVGLAAFFAGSETGLYRLSRFRLRVGIEQKRPFFAVLGHIMRDSHALMFSTLVGTNLTHYIASSIVTYLLLTQTEAEHLAEVYAMIIMTPVLFVFSELIPKNVYFYRADILMPRLAPVLWFFHKVFVWCGAVPLLKLISQSITRLTGTSIGSERLMTTVRRQHIVQLIRDTRDEWILSRLQSDMMDRLVDISNLQIRFVMTPVSKVEMLEIGTGNSELLKRLQTSSFRRWPVYERQRRNIVGFIDIYEALSSGQEFADLRKFVKPIATLSADTTFLDAMNTMRNQGHKIALIEMSRRGLSSSVGIITLKDLVEQLTGELVEW